MQEEGGGKATTIVRAKPDGHYVADEAPAPRRTRLLLLRFFRESRACLVRKRRKDNAWATGGQKQCGGRVGDKRLNNRIVRDGGHQSRSSLSYTTMDHTTARADCDLSACARFIESPESTVRKALGEGRRR